ncbi:D-alanine--D-alanine ligase [Jatrophihabitans telluris]|uniref:D-alanine--D-alanine ligase n=1 Tax=Jatrophihabitans telluris TaxID=2038343 RepID=A0ABY4R2B3_9ACTN|nr:D-alanine--D-alanine ligase family protein [Jatrophihabitans telluris]UQX89960.1 D-alanine--D-alanine ligase [Jatrophihabitans telluris]
MADRIRIALVYGGRSSEHPISVVSAGSVLSAMDPDRYDIVTIGITREGRWIATHVDPASLRIAGRQLPSVSAAADDQAPQSLRAGRPDVFQAGSALAALDGVDVVFPLLHGAFGEDGTIQGMLEMAGIRYVGSGVLASAAGMDKAFTKTVLTAAGLDVGRYRVLHRSQPRPGAADLADLGLPLFVKPARAGSSVGISKVRSYDELPDALELAFSHDSKVLIEAAVIGRELECGVLQDADGRVSASLPAEIRLHADFDWYSFEAKYLDDASDFDIPAQLSDADLARVRAAAVTAFTALECRGLARVDFFLTEDGTLTVNEINTMPGFTPISMYPKMWAETGVGYAELIDRLIATALSDEL